MAAPMLIEKELMVIGNPPDEELDPRTRILVTYITFAYITTFFRFSNILEDKHIDKNKYNLTKPRGVLVVNKCNQWLHLNG